MTNPQNTLLQARRFRWWEPVLWLLAFAAPLALPSHALIINEIAIVALFAISLDLILGYTGIVSLGHAAFFGLGGYALALMSSDNGPVSLWWTLPAAVAVAGLFALVIGFFVVRTRGIYFIMVTMAFAQMMFFLVFDNKKLKFLGLLPLRLGGSDGVYINFKPDAALFDLENKKVFYYFVLACLVPTCFCAACCGSRLAARWPVSASTSIACAPWASAVLATS